MLRLLARGHATAEIARALGTSTDAVTTVTDDLLRRCGLQSRTQAALYAIRLGLVPLDSLDRL